MPSESRPVARRLQICCRPRERRFICGWGLLGALFATGTLLAGCAGFNPQLSRLPLMPQPAVPSSAKAADERLRFQVDRNPQAFSYLLIHHVENGMSVAAVSEVLGEQGELFLNDREMKTNGGQYQQTDVAYKWGPDTNGRSVVLFFRDGKLVHFDADEFRPGR